MGVLATSFDTEKSFTGKQLRAYQRLFVDATDTSETVSFDTYRKVLRIPKDDWRALSQSRTMAGDRSDAGSVGRRIQVMDGDARTRRLAANVPVDDNAIHSDGGVRQLARFQ